MGEFAKAYVATHGDLSRVVFAEDPNQAWQRWAEEECECGGEQNVGFAWVNGECPCRDEVEIEREVRFDKYVADEIIPLEAYRGAGWQRYCEDCVELGGLTHEDAMCGTGDWVVHEGRSLCHDCLRETADG